MKTLIKYPGSKWSYAEWIISLFPEHKVYLEPFFGSGGVYFNKAPSKHEVINDLDSMVVNLFMVCRDKPEELARALYLTPVARKEYEQIQENHAGEDIKITGDPIEDARRFVVRCHQSFGGKLADRAGWKRCISSNAPSLSNLWRGLPETVIEMAERLRYTQIECRPAEELIKAFNNSECLIYADPPYLMETRNSRLYREEMGDVESHNRLIDILEKHNGPVILSGYDNELYSERLKGWHKETKSGYNAHAKKTEEVLWLNYEPKVQISLAV